jgi:hypothetical protein
MVTQHEKQSLRATFTVLRQNYATMFSQTNRKTKATELDAYVLNIFPKIKIPKGYDSHTP